MKDKKILVGKRGSQRIYLVYDELNSDLHFIEGREGSLIGRITFFLKEIFNFESEPVMMLDKELISELNLILSKCDIKNTVPVEIELGDLERDLLEEYIARSCDENVSVNKLIEKDLISIISSLESD